jgi:hypothetical protein
MKGHITYPEDLTYISMRCKKIFKFHLKMDSKSHTVSYNIRSNPILVSFTILIALVRES